MACKIKILKALTNKIEELTNIDSSVTLEDATLLAKNINSQFKEKVVNFTKSETELLNREVNISESLVDTYYNNQVNIEKNNLVTDNIIVEESFDEKLKSMIDNTQKTMFLEESQDLVSVDTVSENLRNNMKLIYGDSVDTPSVNQILDNFTKQDFLFTSESIDLIEKAKVLLNKTNTGIEFVTSVEDKNALMAYNPETNNIVIITDTLKNMTPQRLIQSFLHEVVHGQTIQQLRTDSSFRRDIENVMDRINQKSDMYGWTNSEEFVAEMYTNSEFREEVKSLMNKSIWNDFITTIRRMFGLSKLKNYDELLSSIVEQVEQSNTISSSTLSNTNLIFSKPDIIIPSMVSFESRLDVLINRAKDNMDQAVKRAKNSKKNTDKAAKAKHVENLENLVTEMNAFTETEKLKLVSSYAKSLSNIVYSLKKSLESADYSLPKTYQKVVHYEDYLAAYDLLDEILNIAESAKLNDELSEKDLLDIEEIKTHLQQIGANHGGLKASFNVIKREAAINLASQPRFINQVETIHRNKLRLEYRQLKKDDPKVTESEKEFITRIMNTRDREELEIMQLDFAEEVINNPAHDISALALNLYDATNITSKLIDIVTQITSTIRDKIVTQFTEKNHQLDVLHKKLIKAKGNLKVSELYKNIYEVDASGQHYLRGKFKVEFRDKYLLEFSPILTELKELVAEYKEAGVKGKEYRKNQDYIDLITKKNKWLSENTTADKNSTSNDAWKPKDKYLNPVLTGVELEVMQEFNKINASNVKKMMNMQGLTYTINNGGPGIKFTKLPSITKSDLERTFEGDALGILKDKLTDLNTIKSDDIGFEEAVDGKGNAIRHVKIHFRGKIESKDQSLDLMTMMRMEFLNGVNFKEKFKEESNLKLLYDIALNKDYLKKSVKTGEAMQNIFNTRGKTVTQEGSVSNEPKKIKGMIESNIYDIMSYAAPKLFGADVNKVTSAISGYTASVSMTFNAASGTANVLNGVSQMFIESLGNQFINTKSLLKAEAKYFGDMPNILADLSEANKKSFTNQVLNMFDVFGGFSPEEQSYIQNTVASKILAKESLNAFNAMGEHMMNSVLTMSVLDTLKVMNSDFKFIDKNGNETSEDKAASLLDMLQKDKNGIVRMSPLVAHTSQNMSLDYHEGGKVSINLLIKKKSHDLFGVYDPAFQNELYKQWYGKAIMMFKKFFIAGMQSRYKGIQTSNKATKDLTDDERDYNAAIKEYEEGTYTTLVRFFAQGVLPLFKGAQLSNMSEYYNSLSDYEKGNIKKGTVELITTLVLLPLAGAMLAGAAADAGDDDEWLWFMVYQNRRLQSELSQFRSFAESAKLITNPVAGVRTVQNASALLYDIITPLDFYTQNNDNFFSYLNEDNKGANKMVKKVKKLVPLIPQIDRNWQQMFNQYQ